MIKKLFTLKLLLFYLVGQSQAILTYVGNSALVTIQPNTLVYNGGGLQTAGSAVVNNSGNIMINATSADGLTIAGTSAVNLKYNPAGTTEYGQLYIAGIPQSAITGKVNKEYRSDYQNGVTGRQQTGLPFYNFTIQDLLNTFGTGQINFTNGALNSAGRFNISSIFKWNNFNSKFDQIYVNPNNATVIGSPMTYYILPRRNASGTYFWNPTSTSAADLKVFSGNPASDNAITSTNYIFPLSGQQAVNFGYNGSARNTYGEAYRTYLDDPFSSKTPNWLADYGRNLYQLANPFLTNIDLKFIGTSEVANVSDGNNITNLVGIAYYGNAQINWSLGLGTTFNGIAIIASASNGVFQAGDVSANKLIIKPMGEFMIKLSSAAPQTLDLTKTRRFKFISRADGVDNTVTAAKGSSEDEGGTDIPADKIVKQVAVVMYDLDGFEIDRTYYAISPSAITGYDPLNTNLQAYSTANPYDTTLETNSVAERKIFTKEEVLNGGEDINYTDKLYINEANEIGFKTKEIPLFINYEEQPYQLKFEVYEKGERVPEGLSNGNSFYLKNPQGQIIKIVDGDSISMNGSQSLGLFYEKPESGTLGTGNISSSQTIIAKKDSQWVVRFAKNWKNATVEVYSAAGQLLNSKSNISTISDYSIPFNYQTKSVFLVKATSDKGEVVIKKIVN